MNRQEDLLPQVASFCRHHGLLPADGCVVVGLSGGPDSLALTDLLQRLSECYRFSVMAAHLNHGLRGEAADQDEQVVRDFCHSREIPLIVRRQDIAALAADTRQTVEEAGRAARYDFFRSIADNQEHTGVMPEKTRIAVGHHRDDQAETVLMNLCRGSGLQGLAGMQPRNGAVIRPLLQVSRAQIERYVRMRGLTPCFDQTNAETGTTRNRLRHLALPALRESFGTDPSPAMSRAAELLRVDADYLNQEASAALDRLFPADADWRNGLSVQTLMSLHEAIRTRVLRLWIEHESGTMKDLSEKHVAALDELCQPGRSGHRCSLPGGRQAVRSFDRLLLTDRPDEDDVSGTDAAQTPDEVPLRIPGRTEIPGGTGFFLAEFIEKTDEIIYNNQIWCFAAKDLAGAVVRHRRPQDHIHPAGRACGKTLKKYLTEQQVPVSHRDRLPLIAAGSDILWIPGLTADGRLTRPEPGHLSADRWVLVRYRAMER